MVGRFGVVPLTPVVLAVSIEGPSPGLVRRQPAYAFYISMAMDRVVRALFAGAFLLVGASAGGAQTLRGSPVAMLKQNRIAHQHDYTFLQTSAEVRRFVERGLLVRLSGNANYQLASVSHPYARPAVKTFVERLAAQYRAACGEKLVVTSLTRPEREQPRNASDLSVHPAGMAVDLRVSRKRSCRSWLEKTTLSLEKRGVLEATRERNPSHYHVALYPEQYGDYLGRVAGTAPAKTTRVATNNPAPRVELPTLIEVSTPVIEGVDPKLAEPANVAPATESDEPELTSHRVLRGETLWSIARRAGTTVNALKELNGLKSSQIVVGQVIAVPTAAGADGS